MLGHPLITRAASKEDGLGTILSVIKDSDSYVLKGRLLFPTRIKDNIITRSTIERLKWEEPVEVFDSEGKEKQLLGAGKIERVGHEIAFVLKLISEKHCQDIVHSINKLGSSAFDRIYPVFPVLAVKDEHKICSICENPLGAGDCKHEVGKVYLRTYCRIKVLEASVRHLVWSGVKDFQSTY